MPIFGLIYFLLFIILLIALVPSVNFKIIRNISFIGSSFVFLSVLYLACKFDISNPMLQWSFHNSWSGFLNIYYSGGVDGVSLLFILLTSFLIPLCVLYSWNQFIYFFKELMLLLFAIEFLLFNFFFVSDLFFFFIFFESILFPMFILIGNFGSRQRKIHASFQFFLFTTIGSFLMMIAIFLVFLHEGSTDFYVLYFGSFSYELQLVLWLCFFISLAVKVPLFPVHIWLPEAHVEAPTIGSVILAGVLLKMGTYGMLRFVAPLFAFGNFYFNPLVFILSFMSIYYVSFITFCQIDLKKLIAYSSVAHMGYVTLGLFTFSFTGLQGSIFLMLSHGIVSSLLFFLIGMLYDRYKTRLIFFYKSIYSYMPIFTLFLFFATLANIGFPGTIGFIGEFLLMFSFLFVNKVAFFFSSLGFLISITYAFWLYNRVSFLLPFHIFVFSDLSRREFFVVFPFILMIFFFGLYPSCILNVLEPSSLFILNFNPFLFFF
jgi:NADH-quinone oxidoreductase subunit M